MLALPILLAVGDAPAAAHDEAMTARAEIHRTIELGANASVKVSGIAGPVTIETGSGETAEIDIVRLAASERELACYETRVDGGRGQLTIEHVQHSRRAGCDSIRSRQEVRLRLPASADIELDTIAGAVEIGATDGMIRMSSIAGQVHVASVRAASLNSLAGGVTLGIGRVAPEGVRVNSVVGTVKLAFAREADADLRIDSVLGSVASETPELRLSEEYGTFRARLGEGGRDVRLSSVVGPVRLSRD